MTAPTVAAPFPVGSLKPPLTAVEYATIEAYLTAHFGVLAGATGLPKLGKDDATVIADYEAVVQGGGYNNAPKTNTIVNPAIINPLESVESFLTKLADPKFLTRVAEFAIGGIMLAIAINALVKNTTGVDAGGAARNVTNLSPVRALGRGAKSAATSPVRSARSTNSNLGKSGGTSYARDKSGLVTSSSRGDINLSAPVL